MVFDAIRTPRGRGKASGSLHEGEADHAAHGVLKELQKRHDLDTAQVDDVVMGCVTPVGEQGSCIAKTAALAAGWDYRPRACSSTASAPRAWRR
jgi:acetyl-CoA C-acetyltransferase